MKNKGSEKSPAANPHGHYRRPLPANVRGFEFEEINGIKVLKQGGESNDTLSAIRVEGPALASEITQAMTYCQRRRAKTKITVSNAEIRSKFQTIDRYCDDDQVQAIAISEAGKADARKEAVSILADRLQIKKETIERYFRRPSNQKD